MSRSVVLSIDMYRATDKNTDTCLEIKLIIEQVRELFLEVELVRRLLDNLLLVWIAHRCDSIVVNLQKDVNTTVEGTLGLVSDVDVNVRARLEEAASRVNRAVDDAVVDGLETK